MWHLLFSKDTSLICNRPLPACLHATSVCACVCVCVCIQKNICQDLCKSMCAGERNREWANQHANEVRVMTLFVLLLSLKFKLGKCGAQNIPTSVSSSPLLNCVSVIRLLWKLASTCWLQTLQIKVYLGVIILIYWRCRGSGGRAGRPLIRGSVVGSLPSLVCMSKCPWLRN